MSVISTKRVLLSARAFCKQCNWDDDQDGVENGTVAGLRTRINKHVKATGHSVIYETGYSAEHMPEIEPEQ